VLLVPTSILNGKLVPNKNVLIHDFQNVAANSYLAKI
jgi:hypothetical protein